MNAEYDSIREFNGVWIATQSRMKNLRQGTESMLIVEDLDANADMGEHLFSVFRLHLRRN